ncbi:facilitated trehalose transporter Tret1-like [Ostrinia furnacalis]|uniref:facilitated trehalose transporter Tret1-like n=1 Tax=Ostrinia furnacalis TaxID=93504 RepID=UPI00103E6711|nr:facilitated trehalose transporter Tret1-like [Ostrinia furnacalis]
MVVKMQMGAPAPQTVSRFRSVSSQVIACMSQNLLLLDLGMAISFSTIALPDLLNAKEGLSLTENQASWFGSISYLTQPFGGIISGPIVDYFGRKKATFIVNVPHFVAWILMYYSWNLPMLFIANGLLGFGTGLMEAPINSYVGEITEPSIRGALCTVTQFCTAIGVMLMYLLGNVSYWRTAALICLIAPVVSMLFVLLIPETPVWLLYKGREKDALKSLCYLRGWTTPDNVREEFNELVVYTKNLQRCVICCQTDEDETKDCEHYKMNFIKRGLLKFKYVLLTKETLRPFTLVIMYFLFHTMSGLTPIRPNMVNVCGAFGMADDGKHIVLMIGIITFITSFLVIGLIKILGKRKLAISAMFGSALCCMALSIYAKNNLDPSVFSYDTSTFPTEVSYVPLVFFYGLTVFTGFGIPWVLLGEVFPFRSRAASQGIAAAGNYLITFVGSKTFINFETSIQLWGAFAIYAGFAYMGTIYLYFFLPETEGVTLQEIESYYSGKLRIFADDPIINLFKRKLKR